MTTRKQIILGRSQQGKTSAVLEQWKQENMEVYGQEYPPDCPPEDLMLIERKVYYSLLKKREGVPAWAWWVYFAGFGAAFGIAVAYFILSLMSME